MTHNIIAVAAETWLLNKEMLQEFLTCATLLSLVYVMMVMSGGGGREGALEEFHNN